MIQANAYTTETVTEQTFEGRIIAIVTITIKNPNLISIKVLAEKR